MLSTAMNTTVSRDAEGRKMYPGRFWSWPEERVFDLDNYDDRMEYGICLWTETQENTPTLRQLAYVMHLLNTRVGADPELVQWGSKKGVGKAINEMLKLPIRKGGWARPGREV